MIYLTEKACVGTWIITARKAEVGTSLAIEEMFQHYESAVRCPLC